MSNQSSSGDGMFVDVTELSMPCCLVTLDTLVPAGVMYLVRDGPRPCNAAHVTTSSLQDLWSWTRRDKIVTSSCLNCLTCLTDRESDYASPRAAALLIAVSDK